MASVRSVTIASAFILAIAASAGTGKAFAQGGLPPAPTDPSSLISTAHYMADGIHHWHHNHDWPPDEDYCGYYREADDVAYELRQLLGDPNYISDVDPNGTSQGIPNSQILDAYYRLDGELSEEDDINYEDGWCPCWWPPKPIKYIGRLLSGGYYYNPPASTYTPISSAVWSGYYVGVEFTANWGNLGLTEVSRITGATTNQFSPTGKRDGIGLRFGYQTSPWNNNIYVSPVLQFDYYDQTIRQTFPNTAYLGIATNWSLTAAVNVGYNVSPDFSAYALGGVTLRNAKYEINFLGPITSEDKTVPGLTLGGGLQWRPAFLRRSAPKVSLFAEYQHTVYQDVHLDATVTSPFFNYRYHSFDNVLKLGAISRF